jgi:hypothetical protein
MPGEPSRLNPLDVIHRRPGGARLRLGDVRDGRLREHRTRGLRRVREHAGGAATDRPVEQLDELEHADLPGRARERVTALDAALGAQHP